MALLINIGLPEWMADETLREELEPMLPGASVPTAAGLFGDVEIDSSDDALPQDPAEWLASLGASPSDAPAGDGDDA